MLNCETVKSMSMEELVDQLWWYGCDPYYNDLWTTVMCELERRIEEGEL